MKRAILIIAALLSFLTMSYPLFAGGFGTPDEAREMLKRAVAAVEKGKAKALKDFTMGSKKFRYKDLYVFCFDAVTGKILAHGATASLIGRNVRDIRDSTGYRLGEKLFETAVEGEFRQVDYLWPRPGESQPYPKSSYVIKVTDVICGVGYYDIQLQ